MINAEFKQGKPIPVHIQPLIQLICTLQRLIAREYKKQMPEIDQILLDTLQFRDFQNEVTLNIQQAMANFEQYLIHTFDLYYKNHFRYQQFKSQRLAKSNRELIVQLPLESVSIKFISKQV